MRLIAGIVQTGVEIEEIVSVSNGPGATKRQTKPTLSCIDYICSYFKSAQHRRQ